MNTQSNRPLTCHLFGLTAAVLAVLALAFTLTITTARAASVTLTNSDGFGASSFNAVGFWNPAAAPSAGNSYYITNPFTMRTPATATAYTFAGDALYLFATNTSTSVSLSLKGSNVITIPSLVMSNAIIQNSGTGYTPDTAIIAGNINVLTNSQLNPSFSNRTLVVTAAISGSGGLTFKGSGTNLLNGSHGYNGPITESGVQVNMGSTFSMTPSSLTVGLDEFFYTATTWFSTTNVVAAGGNLNVNGGLSGVLQVGIRRLANTNNAVAALLDVSKQSQFSANVGNVIVGQNQDASGAGGGSCAGTLLLATNNTIITTNFLVGDALVSVAGSGTVVFGAGSNYIDTAILTVGQRKLTTQMTLPAGGTLMLTNSAGGGVNVDVANNNIQTGATSISTLDLSSGIFNATLNQLIVGQKNSPSGMNNNGGATGTMTLSTNAANRVSAAAIYVGYMAMDTPLATGVATGTLTIGGGNVFVNDVNLGYFDGNGGSSVGSLNINGGAFYVTNSIAGGGGTANLNVNGGLLNMANNGSVNVNSLVVNGIITNAASITTADLIGSGSIVGSGTTTVSGTFSPGNTNAAGIMTANSVTFGSSAMLTYNLGTTTTVGSGSNDLLVVNGDLDLGNATLNIALLGSGLTTGTYTLATVTGNVLNSVAVPSTIGRYTLALSINTGTSPKQVNLVVTGNPYSLRWTGVNSAAWDVDTTQNWTNQLS